MEAGLLSRRFFMFDPVKRSLRAVAFAFAIAALPAAALSVSEASAQVPGMAIPGMPDMGEAYPLTPELVAAWAESYPAVFELSETLAAQYDVPAGETPAAGLAAYATVAGAMAQMNDVVTGYGFEDYGQWISVMLSVIFSYTILEAPADQRVMLLGMFGQTQENIDAVSANLEAVAAVVENL